MFDINYIKKEYCRFKCPVKNKTDERNCRTCDIAGICDKLDINCANEELDPCKVCQIDNFIRELYDYKIIK